MNDEAEDPKGKSRHIRPTKENLASWSRSINLAKFPEDGISFDDTKRLITEAYDGRRARNIVSEMLAVLKEIHYSGWIGDSGVLDPIAALIKKAEAVVG